MKLGLGIFVLLVGIGGFCQAAPHPIVAAESGFLLGTSDSGKWTPFEKAKTAVKGGETYRLYNLTGSLGTAKGGKPESAGEPCPDMLVIPLTPKPKAGAIGVAGTWNALPRIPQSAATTQPVYLKAAGEFLGAQGIRNPRVRITQILRIDLEGDGEEEVLISATNYFTKGDDIPTGTVAGSYSCVMLRRVVAGKVQTQLLSGDFYPTAKTFNAPYRHRISAVLDLDGDGKMEVIVHSAYYEGDATTVFRCTGRKPEQLLSVGCGA